MSLTPHEYQLRAITTGKKIGRMFQAIDVGLGKTMITLNIVKDSALPTLVLAPLRVTYQTWPEEIVKWTPGLDFSIIHGPRKLEALCQNRKIKLMNYDGLKWLFDQIAHKGYKFGRHNLVLDESSFVKSPSTQRFKILRKLLPFFDNYRFCLSATPRPQGYHELWSQYYMLDKGERLGNSYYSFRNHYFNYSGPPVYKTTLRSGADKVINKRIADITFRLKAEDWLDLPEIIHNPIYIDLPPKLRQQYDQLEKDFFLEFAESGVEIEAFNAVSLQMKLRQFVQGALYDGNGGYVKLHDLKIKALAETLEGLGGQSILAPIQFKFELAEFRKLLGNDTPVIAGGIHPRESARISDNWNKGHIPLLLVHPKSVSHGLNLQRGGHNICWVGMTWSVEQFIQLIGRLRRQGQVSDQVVVNYILARGTVDEVVYKTVQRNDADQTIFLDYMRDYCRSKYGF